MDYTIEWPSLVHRVWHPPNIRMKIQKMMKEFRKQTGVPKGMNKKAAKIETAAKKSGF